MDNLDKIEYLRQIMHVTALSKGISHPDVLLASQRIDEAINEFHNVSLSKEESINKKQFVNNNMHPKQQAILDFIRNYPHQYSPSIREIAAGVGLSSTSTVHHHLVKLEEKGYIVRKNNRCRCVVAKGKM